MTRGFDVRAVRVALDEAQANRRQVDDPALRAGELRDAQIAIAIPDDSRADEFGDFDGASHLGAPAALGVDVAIGDVGGAGAMVERRFGLRVKQRKLRVVRFEVSRVWMWVRLLCHSRG